MTRPLCRYSIPFLQCVQFMVCCSVPWDRLGTLNYDLDESVDMSTMMPQATRNGTA